MVPPDLQVRKRRRWSYQVMLLDLQVRRRLSYRVVLPDLKRRWSYLLLPSTLLPNLQVRRRRSYLVLPPALLPDIHGNAVRLLLGADQVYVVGDQEVTCPCYRGTPRGYKGGGSKVRGPFILLQLGDLHAHTHIHTRLYLCMCDRTYTHTYVRTYIHTYIQYIHVFMCVCIPSQVRLHTLQPGRMEASSSSPTSLPLHTDTLLKLHYSYIMGSPYKYTVI